MFNLYSPVSPGCCLVCPRRCAQSVEPLARGRPDDLARANAVANRFLKGDGPLLHSMVRQRTSNRTLECCTKYISCTDTLNPTHVRAIRPMTTPNNEVYVRQNGYRRRKIFAHIVALEHTSAVQDSYLFCAYHVNFYLHRMDGSKKRNIISLGSGLRSVVCVRPLLNNEKLRQVVCLAAVEKCCWYFHALWLLEPTAAILCTSLRSWVECFLLFEQRPTTHALPLSPDPRPNLRGSTSLGMVSFIVMYLRKKSAAGQQEQERETDTDRERPC